MLVLLGTALPIKLFGTIKSSRGVNKEARNSGEDNQEKELRAAKVAANSSIMNALWDSHTFVLIFKNQTVNSFLIIQSALNLLLSHTFRISFCKD